MRVGTRAGESLRPVSYWDHPHACGDKRPLGAKFVDVTGSSPCVWGQVVGTIWEKHGLGIIPMRVGTREELILDFGKIQDHPHACGDKTKEIKENSGFAKSTA